MTKGNCSIKLSHFLALRGHSTEASMFMDFGTPTDLELESGRMWKRYMDAENLGS